MYEKKRFQFISFSLINEAQNLYKYNLKFSGLICGLNFGENVNNQSVWNFICGFEEGILKVGLSGY